jgi:hypothetical protein
MNYQCKKPLKCAILQSASIKGNFNLCIEER